MSKIYAPNQQLTKETKMKKQNNNLTPEAIADGIKSGLTKDDMLKLGMYSLDVKSMYTEFGITAEGYAIPYRDGFCRAKILKYISRFGEEFTRKYTQKRGSECQLYLPNIGGINWKKIAEDSSANLLITEGEKKAAAACKAGFNCIGLGGVWNFKSKRGFLREWESFALKGRKILIVYDSDIVDKPKVRQAEYALYIELVALGANVMRVRLPEKGLDGEKVGLDDFLAANGLPESPKLAADAFNKLPQEEIKPAFPPHLSELGNAIRLGQEFGDYIRYVPAWRSWLVRSLITNIWRLDDDGEAVRCAKKLPYLICKEAKKVQDNEAQKKIFGWARNSESEKCLKATLNLAKSESELVFNERFIDADRWEIALGDGKIIDLRTQKVREILPEDYIMKSIKISYDPKAQCPTWEKFLLEVMDGDKSMVRFTQRAIGYSLTGDMREQCFFIAYGSGANGKTTFLNIMLELLGDYARQAAAHTFMAQRADASTARSDLCRLVGIRLVATSETENYQRLSEAMVKQWTGGEQIVTRDLYGKTFEFSPQGKIWLATNHRPQVRGTDDAIWRRIILIPFTRTFAEHERDPKLSEKLRKELPGILNWALKGCKEWQEKGLNPPQSVLDAVKKYRADMDAVGEWLKERCEIGNQCQELIPDLFNDFKTWANQTEEFVYNQRDFARYLEERGYKRIQTTDRRKDKKGWFLKGIQLKNDKRPKFVKTSQPRNKGE